jgi:hypothetical protein
MIVRRTIGKYCEDLQARLMLLCESIFQALPSAESVNCTFQKTTDGWIIGFADDLKAYSDRDGFHYIREIIRLEGKMMGSNCG